MIVSESRLLELANRHAVTVDALLVVAIALVESAGESNAVRYEPGYKWTMDKCRRPAGCSKQTELSLQKHSWGLMQIMGATARSIGYSGWLSALTQPGTNMAAGCAYLEQLATRYKVSTDLISAYNAGYPRRREDGTYHNQEYVDRVMDRRLTLQSMRDKGLF